MGGWRRPRGGDSEYAVGVNKRGGGRDGSEDPPCGSGEENEGTKDGIKCRDDESDMDMDNPSSMIPHDDDQEAVVHNDDDDDEKEGELSLIGTSTALRAGRDTPSPDDALIVVVVVVIVVVIVVVVVVVVNVVVVVVVRFGSCTDGCASRGPFHGDGCRARERRPP